MVDGVEYPIDTDFRKWIEFYKIAKEGGDLREFFGSIGLPFSESAAKAACDFFVGNDKYKKAKECGNKPVVVDFAVDEEPIFAAFYGAYKIDLTEENLHWWKFLALFRSLPQDCEISRIMQYRGTDLKSVPKYHKKFYAEMKSKYRLDKSRSERQLTLDERNEEMKRRVEEAYRKAEMQMSKVRGDE